MRLAYWYWHHETIVDLFLADRSRKHGPRSPNGRRVIKPRRATSAVRLRKPGVTTAAPKTRRPLILFGHLRLKAPKDCSPKHRT